MRNKLFVADSECGWFDIIERKPASEEGITGIDFVCGRTLASCEKEDDANVLTDAYNEVEQLQAELEQLKTDYAELQSICGKCGEGGE